MSNDLCRSLLSARHRAVALAEPETDGEREEREQEEGGGQ